MTNKRMSRVDAEIQKSLAEIISKFDENQKTIRYELAHRLKLRTVPEMTFIVDEVEERASRVLKLFEQIEGESNDVREDN